MIRAVGQLRHLRQFWMSLEVCQMTVESAFGPGDVLLYDSKLVVGPILVFVGHLLVSMDAHPPAAETKNS